MCQPLLHYSIMKAEYNPPIKSRDTKELLSIVENVDDWKDDALAMAREELAERGYSIKTQKNRAKSKKRYKRRVTSIKAEATHQKWELIVLYIFAPFIFAIHLTLGIMLFGDSFLDLKADGYEKKWKQRLLVTTLGNVSWFLIIYLNI